MATNVLITGPAESTLVGGQVTHLKNLIDLRACEKNLKINVFNTAMRVSGRESKIYRFVRFLFSIFSFGLRIRSFDVIHINSTMNNYSFLRDSIYAMISIALERNIILQYHGGKLKDISLLKYRVFSKIFYFISSRCRAILVLTNGQRDGLEGCFKINAKIVRNYVRSPKNKINREYFGLINLLYLGRLNKEKGIFELVEACNLLKSNGFSFKLTVAGDGPEFGNIKEFANNLGVEDKVEFLGEVKGDKKQQVLDSAHIMVLPSYSEGLPYGILEGMSNGLVIVSTRVGAIPEILNHENDVVFVDIKDANSLFIKISALISRPERMELMASRAYAISKQFSFENMADLYLNIWSEVKSGRKISIQDNYM